MRQGSSCLPWEPARCSTIPRSHSGHDSSKAKASSHNNHVTSKQQCPILPIARQWTSWTGNATGLGANSESKPDQASKLKSKSDDVSTQYGSDYSSKLYQVATGHTNASFNTSLDNLKTLPSRPKFVQGAEQIKQTHTSVEEDRARHAPKTQIDVANRGALQLGRPTPSVEVNVARSRCHPRRRPCADSVPTTTPKLRRDTDCTEAIVRLIVFFSTKLVHTIWSQSSVTPKTSKDFNGAGVLPLQVFIQETLRRSKTSYSTLQVALFYLILLRPHVRPCQATQQQYTPGCRALQCGRRMFLTALILASKYLQDRNYSARAWSKISGLPVAEINENERHYLELIKYNLHMSKETFESWSKVVLTICKASGQGPLGSRSDSPPSSPDSLSCSTAAEQPGSSGWWSHHLTRLTAETVKNSKATEEYLLGLAKNAPFVEPHLSLHTPPSSPESLEEILSDQSSPLVLLSSGTGQCLAGIENPGLGQRPAPVNSAPSKPLPPNLPTPQTTPRYDSAFTFSRRSSHSDLRCRSSLQALVGVDRQAINAANLDTCPPPKPRSCGSTAAIINHPLREFAEPSATSWMSSPESSFSDSSSSTRSRSSSVSSVSSVWSVPGHCLRQSDGKPVTVPRIDSQVSCFAAQPQNRVNVGSYSFYHAVGNMHSIPEDVKAHSKVTECNNNDCLQRPVVPRSQSCKSLSRSDDLTDDQIAQLLASLSSQSDGQIQERTDPAAIKKFPERAGAQVNIEPSKKHKRSRSSKGENHLHHEVRQFLRDEQVQVYVGDDNKPTSYVETPDKQAQYPLQQWAHAKKPVPNALHNKRIALQHSSSPQQKSAPELAAEFLRQSVAVM